MLCLNISECALFVDFALLYIRTILYHASDVFNKVVLDNVIRKIIGDIRKVFCFVLKVIVETYINSEKSLSPQWGLISLPSEHRADAPPTEL